MNLDRENSQKFQKKFYRRTALFTWLWCAAILNAVDLKVGREKIVRQLLTQDGLDLPQIPHRPFAPHVQVIGESEIQVSWLPVLVSNKQAIQYELYSGDDLEYVGYDLAYVAKRLKPATEYKFKVRACGLFGCSEFSLTRSCKTPFKAVSKRSNLEKKPFFGKRRVFLLVLPPLAIVTLLTTLVIFTVYFWRFLRYYLWQYSAVSFDATLPNKTLLHFIYNLEVGDTQQDSSSAKDTCLDMPLDHSAGIEKQHGQAKSKSNLFKDQAKLKRPPEIISKIKEPRSDSWDMSRARASSLGNDLPKTPRKDRLRSVSEGEIMKTEADQPLELSFEQPPKITGPSEESFIVIDNSNVFIGAREAACARSPKLRPRHVKVRLQALAHVLENGRKVSRRFACGSSPPANEHVWDVYRRLGYTVDLEDRRGKDEQRVDEQLHLYIYKAIIEMPPHTLVLASGDGSKGKSSGGTSFPECASAAIEHGWNVEVHSWKHSLSAEWLKLAAKHKSNFKIKYLDENIDMITSIDLRGRNRDRIEESGRDRKHESRFRA
ncbi:uncharacterized protein LOC135681312 [Rhopilema esculentum]|uniref:uncharacterized protein LOC135681312 n=1 Tax=Rhopilema esculentum TaxID=499914 RepID=UPI0031E1E0B5